MRIFLITLLVCPLVAQPPLRGFAPDQWKAQHDREASAKDLPQPQRIRTYMERMSAKPHHAGSPGSRAVAEYAVAQLKEWGLDARIETFEALLPYPTARTLEMTAPTRFRAQLKEPVVADDPNSGDLGQLPTYNAYSATGDVTAPLVYVNYGVPEDYEWLKQQGIDVKGKIVIARYGRSWRGVKPKVAQEMGAVGCLIYSDPRDDGYFQGDVYPKGPMRPSQGVQRGSVMDMAIYPGDPLTPGYAAEPGVKRLTRAESKVLLKIPVMPISYGDAQPLLAALGGPVVPEAWRGALPITYHAGPGATVHFKLDFDWTNKPVHDVIATIPGSVYPDQWIIWGNHHDAWVNGASDPLSGASALLETARTLSLMRKQGWQPKRTIMLALWDGEEFGLVGSTEWVEKHKEEIERKAVVYINSDTNGRGALSASGSHSLEAFMKEVMRDSADPVTKKSLLDAAPRRRAAPSGGEPQINEFHLGALGSGSDYVAFVDHVGIASLNLGFGGADPGGVYHSIYDSFHWYTTYSDGDFVYGKALAQVLTTTLTRLADAPVLPFEFGTLARMVRTYVTEIQKEAKTTPIDFNEVLAQLTRLTTAARLYDDELAAVSRRAASIAPEKLVKVNDALQRAERTLLLPDGLPGRDWYRHQLYAPGLYTGYGAKTLPGVREAVEAQRWDEANRESRRVAQALKALVAQVDEATRLLKQVGE
ncbi:MAG TPA: M28 family metallopeptidase [Bryobacteraceae bacterium]|jgi:N-acetylated-alpha-linked acidic dipeptidase|nr:M28 family metallopeptidase [Bryobacteraceae bacterium]